MGQTFQGAFSNTDVDTAETILEIQVRTIEELWIEFVVGTANLSAFTVALKVREDGNWFTVASAAGDYTTPEGPILGASGDLTVAASGATVHWLKLDVRGVDAVRLQAAGTSSTVAGSFGGY